MLPGPQTRGPAAPTSTTQLGHGTCHPVSVQSPLKPDSTGSLLLQPPNRLKWAASAHDGLPLLSGLEGVARPNLCQMPTHYPGGENSERKRRRSALMQQGDGWPFLGRVRASPPGVPWRTHPLCLELFPLPASERLLGCSADLLLLPCAASPRAGQAMGVHTHGHTRVRCSRFGPWPCQSFGAVSASSGRLTGSCKLREALLPSLPSSLTWGLLGAWLTPAALALELHGVGTGPGQRPSHSGVGLGPTVAPCLPGSARALTTDPHCLSLVSSAGPA